MGESSNSLPPSLAAVKDEQLFLFSSLSFTMEIEVLPFPFSLR